jgi:pimeloyl-ACP methyl ester carboxylesterase
MNAINAAATVDAIVSHCLRQDQPVAGSIATPAAKTIALGPGLELDYVERGDPAGVPLVLLHGYTDSWRSYELLLDALPKWIHAIAFSQRGHGDSDKPSSRYDASVFAADLAAFMNALDIERAFIAGHSMGSLVAQRFALDYAKRTLGLVLLGAFGTLKGNAGVEELWRESVAMLKDPVDAKLVREFQESTLAKPVPPDFFEMIVAESLKVPAHVWRSALRDLLDDDFSGEAGTISTPSLIVWGDRDPLCSQAEQEALRATIRGSRLVVHTGSGHSPHWEDPQRAAADIAAFVCASDAAIWPRGRT